MTSRYSQHKIVLISPQKGIWIMKIITNIFLQSIISFLLITSSLANEIVYTNQELSIDDKALLSELLTIVDESTAIAPKARMNANSVPGTVTVLHGKELESLGIRTAWDALALVPGFLPTREINGGTSVVARGLSFSFSSGNIKILINCLSMARESAGYNSGTILQIPIELIKRIEVVRGPGAVLYGDNAFMGLVNIITYSEHQRLFTRVESNGAISGGASDIYSNAQHHIQIQANFYGYDHDSADTPSPIVAKEERQFAEFSLKFHDFTVNTQSYHRDFQTRNRPFARERNDIFSAHQFISITPTLNSELEVSYLHNDFNLAGDNYMGDKIEGSIDFHWTRLVKHQWWFNYTYTDETIDDVFRGVPRQNLPPPNQNPPPPGQMRPPPTPLLLSNVPRKHYSLSLQDQFELTDLLTITSSIRFDHRDDLGKDFFTPRVSAVWRITDEHILKAQYAEGFRVPISFELFTSSGRRQLEAETIATSEISYIYHQAEYTGKITVFFSKIDNMIFLQQNSFENTAEAESIGVEVEWEQQLTRQLKWQANLSYLESWDTRTSNRSRIDDLSSTNWLSNLAIFYQVHEKVILTAHWNFTGQRNKLGFNLDAENRLNLTLNVSNIFTKGLAFKAGIQNVFIENEHETRTSNQSAT